MIDKNIDNTKPLGDYAGIGHRECGEKAIFREFSVAYLLSNLDKSRNPRDEIQYRPDNPDMASLVTHINAVGVESGSEPLVHIEPDGTPDVLQGHMRIHALSYCGYTKVSCRVITGLTHIQKLAKVHDHGQVAAIGLIGEYKAVANWRGILGRHAIAQKLGFRVTKATGKWTPDVNRVQFYQELSELPEEIRESWFAQVRDPKSKPPIKVSRKVVRDLYKAQSEDETAGFLLGNGPAYTAAVVSLKNEVAAAADPAASGKKKALTPKEIRVLAKMSRNLLLKQYLHGIAGAEYDHAEIGRRIESALDSAYPNPTPVNVIQEGMVDVVQPATSPLSEGDILAEALRANDAMRASSESDPASGESDPASGESDLLNAEMGDSALSESDPLNAEMGDSALVGILNGQINVQEGVIQATEDAKPRRRNRRK